MTRLMHCNEHHPVKYSWPAQN